MRRLLASRRAWALVVPVVALALTALGVPAAEAGSTKSSTVTATISPTKVTVGDTTAFQLRFTVGTSSSNSLGAVQVVVPAGFSVTGLGPSTTPSGWVYATAACAADSPSGCGAAGTTLVQVNTPSSNGANKVGPGQTLTISITATAGHAGTATWNVASKNSAAWSTGQLLTPQGGMPTVTVSAAVRPPAKLVVSGPSALAAGDTLGVDVTVTDADDNPVDPQVQVGLAVDGVDVASQTTVGGSTSFSVPGPTTPGTHSFTVSSSGLSSTSSFTVSAGPPVKLTIDGVSDQAGTGTLTKNAPFDVVVTARDAYDNAASYTGTVTLSTSGGTGHNVGTLAGTTTASFAGQSSATVTGATYTGYANLVQLSAAATGLTTATTSIDVQLFVTVRTVSPGQNVTLTSPACTDATPSVPVCSSLILPKGANGLITLSQGDCNPFTPCITGPQNAGLLVDARASLTDALGKALYTRTAPATLQLRCDKTLCGGSGTNNFPMLYQSSLGGPFQPVPACPSKGRIGANQTFCQDYVQDHRDNAGDLLAYLLFLDDVKSGFS